MVLSSRRQGLTRDHRPHSLPAREVGTPSVDKGCRRDEVNAGDVWKSRVGKGQNPRRRWPEEPLVPILVVVKGCLRLPSAPKSGTSSPPVRTCLRTTKGGALAKAASHFLARRRHLPYIPRRSRPPAQERANITGALHDHVRRPSLFQDRMQMCSLGALPRFRNARRGLPAGPNYQRIGALRDVRAEFSAWPAPIFE